MKFLVFLLNLLTNAYEGLIFMLLWGWFIAPTFGLPELSFWIALGIILTIELATLKMPHAALLEYQITRLSDERLLQLELTKLMTAGISATVAAVMGFIIHLLA